MRAGAYIVLPTGPKTFLRGQAVALTMRSLHPYFLVLLAPLLHAQSPNLPAAAQRPDAVEVKLGQAAVPLYGPWRFTIGDSPINAKTGQPLWAEPGFDDSNWETVDLTPKEGEVDPSMGSSGFVPGWTARGHAGYAGYAWYRIRFRCQSQEVLPLALAGPAFVDDAYQAFADAKLLGSFGNFSGARPVVYYTQPFQLRLPQSCRETGPVQVLAFRFWMEPATLLDDPDAGGMHSAPLLGEAGVIGLHYQSQWLELIRADLAYVAQALVFALLAVVAFSLILFDRSDRVYLWIGLLFLVTAFVNIWGAISAWTQWIPDRLTLLQDGVSGPVISRSGSWCGGYGLAARASAGCPGFYQA